MAHPENRVIEFVLLPISPAELGKTTNTTFTTSKQPTCTNTIREPAPWEEID